MVVTFQVNDMEMINYIQHIEKILLKLNHFQKYIDSHEKLLTYILNETTGPNSIVVKYACITSED